MSDLKNLWQDGYDTAKKETAETIEQLQARCYPSKVIMIEDTGHYVSEKINDHIEQLQADNIRLVDELEKQKCNAAFYKCSALCGEKFKDGDEPFPPPKDK